MIAAAAALALAGPAHAKSFWLPEAHVDAELRRDGSVAVEERITFSFDGDFSGAFRDVPLARGRHGISEVQVREGGVDYRPGGCTELGCTSPPGTFGVELLDGRARIVWHYRASSEQRTFTVAYRLAGVAVAYDDVVDVHLKVWGDEWEQPLSRLTATVRGPGVIRRAWGHPVTVRGDVTLEGESAALRAVDVPPQTFVEARVLFARDALASTEGAQVRRGAALQRIVAEELEDARAWEEEQARVRRVLDDPLPWLLLLLALGLLPAATATGAVWWTQGRERSTGYDREYEQEPPSPLEPALVPPLLAQRAAAGSHEFTATLFDLIRRGRYRAEPTTTERAVWGGLRRDAVADLELSPGDRSVALAPFEEPVAKVVDWVLRQGPTPLSGFRERIERDRVANSERFASFRREVTREIRQRRWYVNRGAWLLVPAAIALLALGAVLVLGGLGSLTAEFVRWRALVLLGTGAVLLLNGGVLGVAATRVPLWRRRSADAQAEAERWEAFRRYLTDFPRLHEAPPASLELWERYLVYGIALGIAERVLQGAQLHMPAELHEASTIYWISPHGDLGSGASALAIGDLSSGFGSALAPPSSGSGGGGASA
ncbi:MAG TPA: DUF2207 domain-containing protein, partial [Gaiellaceae bacterium]|nr:DUF2207 domain-containing protein [Gaiellaceae bacterium]